MRLPTAWRPMVAWAVAAVLCAPLALSLLVFGPLAEQDAATAGMDAYVELLERDFAPPPEDAEVRRGLVFAMSGLNCATVGPKRLPGGRIDLTVVTRPAASLLDFRLLIDPVIAARPDFVIVQSTMLVVAPRSALWNAAKGARSFWRRFFHTSMQLLVIEGLLGREDTWAPEPETPFRCGRPRTWPMKESQDALGWLTYRMMPPVDRRRDQMRAILLRFAEAGIPVLIVTPPVNGFAEAYYARVNEEARSTVGPAAGTAAIFFLEPSRLWPDEQFLDLMHIDPSRNESYRAWLSAAIAAAVGN